MSKFSIILPHSLTKLKDMYRHVTGMSRYDMVSKEEVTDWLTGELLTTLNNKPDVSNPVGHLYFTDIFKNDIIIVTQFDHEGCFGYSVIDGKWNGNVIFHDMYPASISEVVKLIQTELRINSAEYFGK